MARSDEDVDNSGSSYYSPEAQSDQIVSIQPRPPVVPAACTACRSKHLKCDGVSPCSRCATHRIECTYIRSRRGYKGPRRNKIAVSEKVQTPPQDSLPTMESCPLRNLPISLSQGLTRMQGPVTPKSNYGSAMSVSSSSNGSPQDLSATSRHIDPGLRERCLESYFHYVASAHPCILPRASFLMELTRKPLLHLEAAMRYAGSFHIPGAPGQIIENETQSLLLTAPRDGFTVQALLVLAIAFDSDNQGSKAMETILKAQDIALEIGMNQRAFAVLHGQGSPIMEESWRRTWWELYCVDGLLAGVHNKAGFRLWSTPCDVLLPCEEYEYDSGLIPPPHSMEEFEDDAFLDESIQFSSFTYRIAALKNMGRILQLKQVVFPDDPIIQRVDSHLVNWALHLPASKKLGINIHGEVDEMLFQAQMVTAASTIVLHKPHSQLDTTPTALITSCGPQDLVAGGQKLNIHAAKTINAASTISQLVALPTSLQKHTHFFTCVVTSSSIVHLSCWASLLPLSDDENLKQQIKLNAGALRVMGQVWPCADRVMYQVRGVAGEVLRIRKARLQDSNEGFWRQFTDDEMIRCIVEDEAIVSGFQLT